MKRSGVRKLKTLVEMKTTEEDRIRRELDVIDKYKHWTVLGYKNRDAMLQAEVGFKRNDIIRRIKSGVEPAVQKHGTNQYADAKGGGDNVTSTRGNALSYIAKRLARDAPDILDRWATGIDPRDRAELTRKVLDTGRPKKGVCHTPLPKGVSSDRLTARIARDAPAILERMKAGEIVTGCYKPRVVRTSAKGRDERPASRL